MVLWVSAFAAGCYSPTVPLGVKCTASGECPTSQICDSTGTCVGSLDEVDAATDAVTDAVDALDVPLQRAPLARWSSATHSASHGEALGIAGAELASGDAAKN